METLGVVEMGGSALPRSCPAPAWQFPARTGMGNRPRALPPNQTVPVPARGGGTASQVFQYGGVCPKALSKVTRSEPALASAPAPASGPAAGAADPPALCTPAPSPSDPSFVRVCARAAALAHRPAPHRCCRSCSHRAESPASRTDQHGGAAGPPPRAPAPQLRARRLQSRQV